MEGMSSEPTSKASAVIEQGKEKAHELGDVAKEKVLHQVESQKTHLVEGLDQLASTLEGMQEGPPKQIGMAAARFVRRASSMLREHSADELARRAVSELRQRPGAIIAGCFAAGFFGARLLKGES